MGANIIVQIISVHTGMPRSGRKVKTPKRKNTRANRDTLGVIIPENQYSATPVSAANDDQSTPRTKEEYTAYAQEFVTKDLQLFFGQNSSYVKKIAEKAAQMANKLADEFDVEREWIPGLVKLTLYDFIIFCGRFLPRRDLILHFLYEFGLRLMQITAILC